MRIDWTAFLLFPVVSLSLSDPQLADRSNKSVTVFVRQKELH